MLPDLDSGPTACCATISSIGPLITARICDPEHKESWDAASGPSMSSRSTFPTPGPRERRPRSCSRPPTPGPWRSRPDHRTATATFMTMRPRIPHLGEFAAAKDGTQRSSTPRSHGGSPTGHFRREPKPASPEMARWVCARNAATSTASTGGETSVSSFALARRWSSRFADPSANGPRSAPI